MDREKHHRWIRSLEIEAATDPSRLRSKALLLHVLGFLYLGVILALVGWLFVASIRGAFFAGDRGVWIFLGFLSGAVLLSATRALLGGAAKPRRIRLDLGEHPALARELESLRKELSLPDPAAVWISEEANAGVLQLPLLNAMGSDRHHLQLGMPLLASFDEEEMRGVLAHELAHLRRDHGSSMGWVIRFHMLFEALGTSSFFVGLLLWPFGLLFGRRLEGYAGLISRAQEYEADAVASSLVGPEAMTRALLILHGTTAFLEETFALDHCRRHLRSAEPPGTWLREMIEAVTEIDPAGKEFCNLLEEHLALQTEPDDSHPSLSDRIKALQPRGWPSVLLIPAFMQRARAAFQRERGSASLGRLIENPDLLIERLDRDALGDLKESWGTMHVGFTRDLKRFEALKKMGAANLGEEEGWEFVRLTAEANGIGEGREALGLFLHRFPLHPQANLRAGADLLREGNARGLLHLEKASADWICEADAIQLRSIWHRRRGEVELAEQLEQSNWKKMDVWEAAFNERQQVDGGDEFLPHGLDSVVVDRILEQIKDRSRVTSVYLVKRKLRHEPERPQLLLVFELRRKTFRLADEGEENLHVQMLSGEIQSPYDTYFASFHSLSRRLGKRVCATRGAKIWEAA